MVEVRKARGKDTHCACLLCGKKFPPRPEIEALADETYPDLKTIKWIAKLEKMRGN